MADASEPHGPGASDAPGALVTIKKYANRRLYNTATSSYVTLEHLKRIEGEVFSTYQSIAERQTLLESGHTVDPHQLLGI